MNVYDFARSEGEAPHCAPHPTANDEASFGKVVRRSRRPVAPAAPASRPTSSRRWRPPRRATRSSTRRAGRSAYTQLGGRVVAEPAAISTATSCARSRCARRSAIGQSGPETAA